VQLAGETELSILIRSMRPRLRDGVFAFLTLPRDETMAPGMSPVMMFDEGEGRTLILPRAEAEASGFPVDFPSRMITLDVHSHLGAVGFLAAVTTRLAAAGIAVNPVSAFFHDHLFVPEARADEAMRVLSALVEENASKNL